MSGSDRPIAAARIINKNSYESPVPVNADSKRIAAVIVLEADQENEIRRR